MENKQTLGEWLNENKKDALKIINDNLKKGVDYHHNVIAVKGQSKRDCYREVNKILKINIIEQLRIMDLKYDGVPLIFNASYDRTSNDTTSNRQIDFYISIDKKLDTNDEDDSPDMILCEFNIVITVKLEQTSNASSLYLVKDFNLSSTDKPLEDMINWQLEYMTKQHREANDRLKNRVEQLRVKLLSALESIDNGNYDTDNWINDSQKYVRMASKQAQNSINFFKTIEEIKSRMNK